MSEPTALTPESPSRRVPRLWLLPRGRLTVRRLMLLVVALALPLAVVSWVLREQERRRLFGRWYEHKNRAYNIWVVVGWEQYEHLPGGGVPYRPGTPPESYRNAEWDRYVAALPPAARAQWAAIERRYAYHIAMWHKWERAGPWEAVEPDPPPPPVPGLDGQFPY